MANQITGKILSIGPAQNIPSRDGGKMYVKRELVVDATRFDPYTGERGYENTPSFEFFGDRCNDLNGFQVGQIVTISFDVQGSPYTTKDGQRKIITSVRPYRIELRQQPQPAPPAQQPQPAPQRNYQQYQPQQQYNAPFPPTDNPPF